eukprot:CAMPEP_0119406184 /NCGR_PEP_ID=MMETSP1335-20130426/612_1 /TAXON_ID=259385 /ORGANISM="Chrysoculter rhomboideus, Strain RCC1486" /LENGTH=52 /DNA_ID=CAMNT_0007430249 /DNA_START=282 /DNA_END=440 /DNA_ORIENTATION=-
MSSLAVWGAERFRKALAIAWRATKALAAPDGRGGERNGVSSDVNAILRRCTV